MITLTKSAVNKIKNIQAEDDMLAATGLRIAVVGGGCSGLSYKLEFEKEPTKEDKVLEIEGIKIFVDGKSSLYLKGLVLDYKDGLQGTGFSFTNPNANRQCGCGTSFGV
jgi:iron-sulfur cluster assembly protein